MALPPVGSPVTSSHEHDACWKPGPMPADTYWWGGVVPVGEESSGFYFADFCGDSVNLVGHNRTLKADEIAFYNNHIHLPPCCPKGTGLRSS